MARYLIEVDDEDRESMADAPWNAQLTDQDDAGKMLASGFGATPRDALDALLDDVLDYDDAPDWVKP